MPEEGANSHIRFFLNRIDQIVFHKPNKYQMPPDSGGVQMVGCSLARLVYELDHLQKIQEAVSATHKATILTELLTLYL